MSVPDGDLQDKKNEKYDRQLRLWGPEGQQRIELSHICVLNGGAVGAETLKNLVLPGIGEFTIIDGNKVSQRDLGNNFFIEIDSIGKNRAEEVTRLLFELNDMVRNKNAIVQDPETLIDSNPDFVKDYTVIVATELSPSAIVKLSAAVSKHNKILVVVRIYGLIGYIRVQAGEHTIVQTKPSFAITEDLRINVPFVEFEQFANSVVYSELDDMHFAHIPYPIILLKELQTWKEHHEGKLPTTDQDKDSFKIQIKNQKRKPHDNENFDEAVSKAHYAWLPYKITDELHKILNDPKATSLTPGSSPFWLMASAVRTFVHNEGKLPLMGTIPDMTADTRSYVALQQIFRDKGLRDADVIKGYLQSTLKSLELPLNTISDDEIRLFCKNSLFLHVIRYSTLVDELDPAKVDVGNLSMTLVDWTSEDPAPGDGCWYLALRAADQFYHEHGRYPGEKTNRLEHDFVGLRHHADRLMNSLGLEPSQLPDEDLRELCRFGNSQIHTIAAILGGIGAQEIIKLVTAQWVPLDNTFIFNGIHSTSASIHL